MKRSLVRSLSCVGAALIITAGSAFGGKSTPTPAPTPNPTTSPSPSATASPAPSASASASATVAPTASPAATATAPGQTKKAPTPKPVDGRTDWNGTTSSDFNTAGNWTPTGGTPGSAPPVAGDVAWFTSTPINKNVNLSTAVSISGFYFNGTSASGYDITSSTTAIKFTLTATGTTIGTEQGDTTAVAIGAENTSGSNTIDAPIILAPTTGTTSTFSQTGGGTLIVNGIISSTGTITLSLAGGGTFTLAAANTYSGGTTLASGTTLNINNAGSGGTSSAIGTGTLTINGGTIDNTSGSSITLSTNNAQNWNGDFTFTGTNNLNLGTGAVTLNGNRQVTVSGGILTVSGAIGGAFSLTKAGPGTLTLQTATNTYSGGTLINSGTLTFAINGSLGTGAVTLGTAGGGDATLVTSNNAASPTNNITVSSGSGGTLTFGSQSTASSSGSTYSGTITLTGDVNLTSSYGAGGSLKLSGVISGGGALTKVGVGQANFTGASANTYTGLTTVSAGTLGLGKTASVNAFGGDLTINGGSLLYSSSSDNQIPDSAKVTLSSGTLDFGTRTETIGQTATPASGLLVSGGIMTKGTGTVTIANSATMTGGSMSLTGNSGVLAFNTEFNFGGGTIDFTSTSGTSTAVINLRGGTGTGITYSSSGTSTAQITNSGGGSASLSLNSAASATTVFNIADAPTVATEMIIAVPITGAGKNLQKSGAGVLALNGANTYTGTTTVNGGTLLINGSTVAASAVTVNSTGTLGGTGTVNGTVQVNNGGTLSPGTSPGTLTTGAVTMANGSTLAIDLTPSANDVLVTSSLTLGAPVTGPSLSLNITGSLTNGQQFFIVNNTGANAVNGVFAQGATITSGQYTFLIDYLADFGTQSATGGNDIMLQVTAIPEPSTWIGAGLALTAIGWTQRKRLRKTLP